MEITFIGTAGGRELKDGEPCNHLGCLSHITHPCEGCGRIGGIKTMTRYDAIRLSAEVWSLTVKCMEYNHEDLMGLPIEVIKKKALEGTPHKGVYCNDCPCCEYISHIEQGCRSCPAIELWGGDYCMLSVSSQYRLLAFSGGYDNRSIVWAKEIRDWFKAEQKRLEETK